MSTSLIFQKHAPLYWERGISVVPVEPGTKRPAAAIGSWNGYCNNIPSEAKRTDWLNRFGHCNIGLLANMEIIPGQHLGAVDVDRDELVRVTEAILGACPSGKQGRKGATFFVRVAKREKVFKTSLADHARAPACDILLGTSHIVIPPSIHPQTKEPYRWIGKPLLECSWEELPIFDRRRLGLLTMAVGSKFTPALLTGEGTHDSALRLVAQMAGIASDEEITSIVRALLPQDYSGNTIKEAPGFIKGARSKGMGARSRGAILDTPGGKTGYDPGEIGPRPIGVVGNAYYFRTVEGVIARKSPGQLTSPAELFDMAPKAFWEAQFPKVNKEGVPYGIDHQWAGDALMQAGRQAGRVDPSKIRGAGVWLEGDDVVVNFGPKPIEGKRFVYAIPSKPVELRSGQVPVERVLAVLSCFNWVHPGAPQLLLGWATIAVICGVLDWRPHLGLTGPRASGKTTVIKLVRRLLGDGVLYFEGTSTEAGIRQELGADARGIIVDELEMERSGDQQRIERIIKFIRSVSSSEGKVVRGTTDGRPLTFSVNSTFLVAAINLYRVSAADTSRMVRLELKPPERQKSDARDQIQQLLVDLRDAGPDFCQLALDHVSEVRSSIPIFHRALNAESPREADNLAPLLAGYFVALHRRTVSGEEALSLAHEHAGVMQAQREENELDDNTECLNVLLGHDFVLEGLGEEARDRRTFPIGHVLALFLKGEDLTIEDQISRVGIRKDGDGFLIANSHPGLTRVFRGTRWDGGLWGSALSRLEGAEKHNLRRFPDGVRSRGVWLPKSYINEWSFE